LAALATPCPLTPRLLCMGLFFRFFVGGHARTPATPPLGGFRLAFSDRVAPKKKPGLANETGRVVL
jgi:hypothetical protein